MKKIIILALILVLNLHAQVISKDIEQADLEVSRPTISNNTRPEHIISEANIKINAIYPSKRRNVLGISYPGSRGVNQLVIYKREYGRKTLTNEFGKEAVVESGVVVELSGADSIIPHYGYVVSGHGKAKNWINENLQVGTIVELDEKNYVLKAYTTPDSYRYSAKAKIMEVEKIVKEENENLSKANKSNINKNLKRAKRELKRAKTRKIKTSIRHCKNSMLYSSSALGYSVPYVDSELKGVWIRPTQKNEAEVEKTLDEMQELGLNAVFIETYYHGKTIFPSEVMQKYGFSKQNPLFKGYDPLAAFLKGAHKRDMQVHIWFETFYIGNKPPKNDKESILSVKPSWGNKNRANANSTKPVPHVSEHLGYFLDPANPEVREFLMELILELSSKYDIDGLNLDYIRYPISAKEASSNYEPSNWGYTTYARNEFSRLYGADPLYVNKRTHLWDRWNEYRQDKITNFVKKVKKTLELRNIVLSTVIFTDYKQAVQTKQQDWQKWAQEGHIDLFTPLILTTDNKLTYSTLDEMKKKVGTNVKIYPGLFVGFMEAHENELLKQLHIIRQHDLNGVMLFDWAHTDKKYQDVLKTCAFNKSCK